jgi:hypothetical protein
MNQMMSSQRLCGVAQISLKIAHVELKDSSGLDIPSVCKAARLRGLGTSALPLMSPAVKIETAVLGLGDFRTPIFASSGFEIWY